MRIEFWADVTCPWAFLAWRRLATVIEPADEVVWRPFLLDPAAAVPAEPLAGESRDPIVGMELRPVAGSAAPQRVYVRMSDLAAEAGIDGDWRPAWQADTRDAQRLLALAYAHGGAALQGAVVERLFASHFLEGLDVSTPEVLAAASVAAGFTEGPALLAGDAGDARETGDTGTAELRELLLIGKAHGVPTSPTLRAGGHDQSGAQPVADVAGFLRTAREAAPARRLPEEVERLRWAEALVERDPRGALVLLGPLAAEHGRDPNVRRVLAVAYYASAQLGRALEVLEAMVEEDPGDSYARMLYGRTLKRLGRFAEGEVQLRLAGAMTPDYS